MSHLMTPDRACAVGAAEVRLGFGAPGYAHPMLAPAEWAELARPHSALHWAVLDVEQGPGSRADPYCRAAAAGVRERGTPLLGRLALDRGRRPFGELISDAHRFLDWYGVDGFYLAGAPSGSARLYETRRTVLTLRALCRGGGPLVLEHGTHPHPGYADFADQLVTFSGSWTDYRWSQVAEWTADLPPERFCHLVHGLPRTHLEEALRVARWQGAGTVWFTDRTARDGLGPWEALPGYWDEIVSLTGTGVSE